MANVNYDKMTTDYLLTFGADIATAPLITKNPKGFFVMMKMNYSSEERYSLTELVKLTGIEKNELCNIIDSFETHIATADAKKINGNWHNPTYKLVNSGKWVFEYVEQSHKKADLKEFLEKHFA